MPLKRRERAVENERERQDPQDIDFFSETAFPPLETSCKKELSVLRLTAGERARTHHKDGHLGEIALLLLDVN